MPLGSDAMVDDTPGISEADRQLVGASSALSAGGALTVVSTTMNGTVSNVMLGAGIVLLLAGAVLMGIALKRRRDQA